MQIMQKYQYEPQVCPDYSGKPLGIGQCFTAFVALGFGVTLGAILFT